MEKTNSQSSDITELYADLASMERTIVNLRNKITKIERKTNYQEKVITDKNGNHLKAIGKRLMAEREAKGYNLFHAARKSGLRYETIQSLEEGKGTVKNLIKYGSSLGLFFCFFQTSKY